MATDVHERQAAEIRRLFAELGEAYARAAALMEAGDTPQGQIGQERRKASAIMDRIREIQDI